MTSTPVSVGMASYVAGTVTTTASSGNDAANSFSDVLKGQKSEQRTEETKSSALPARVEKHADRVSDSSTKNVKSVNKADGEASAKETEAQVEKAAEAAAGEMVKETAKELGITEEEVLEILGSLSMTPMDLLNPENLQAVVLAAAGETDACTLVTNEQLFSTFQNLTDTLETVVAQVAEETGLDTAKVEEIFKGLMAQPKSEEAIPVQTQMTEGQAETIEKPASEENLVSDGSNKTSEEENVSGEKIMLERSLSKGSDAQTESGSFKESTPNSFAQNQVVQNQVVAQTESPMPVSYFDADTEMILNQITDYMKSQITDGVSELEMQLHPESLGNLHIHLTAKEGALTAQFTAQNETVKAALETQMIQLKETFKEQGITVDAIEVTVESHRFDENFGGNSSNMQGEERQPGRQARRKLNLNLLTEDDLTEEEKLAADMLKESGGTLDYTV